MPAQSIKTVQARYSIGDRAPALLARLDYNDEPINLTGKTVVINIAWTTYSEYYSPQGRLVDEGPCIPDPDQDTNTGWVRWYPADGDLSVAGQFHYQFVIDPGGPNQMTIEPANYKPLIVKTPAGGRSTA